MDIIILAGGKGSRMDDDLPKPLVRARDKAIISHQLDYLAEHANQFILALGHRAPEVIGHIKENHPNTCIEFSIEQEPLGTAGALKQALLKTKTDFVLALNCDDITDIDIHEIKNIRANTICVAHPILPFGRVIEQNGHAFFEEKPRLNDWVSCGWYVFSRQELINLTPDRGSLEYDVFPNLKLKLYKHEGFWKPLNTKKDLVEFNNCELPEKLK